jgi:hypothetical protein
MMRNLRVARWGALLTLTFLSLIACERAHLAEDWLVVQTDEGYLLQLDDNSLSRIQVGDRLKVGLAKPAGRLSAVVGEVTALYRSQLELRTTQRLENTRRDKDTVLFVKLVDYCGAATGDTVCSQSSGLKSLLSGSKPSTARRCSGCTSVPELASEYEDSPDYPGYCNCLPVGWPRPSLSKAKVATAAPKK